MSWTLPSRSAFAFARRARSSSDSVSPISKSSSDDSAARATPPPVGAGAPGPIVWRFTRLPFVAAGTLATTTTGGAAASARSTDAALRRVRHRGPAGPARLHAGSHFLRTFRSGLHFLGSEPIHDIGELKPEG